MDSTYRLGLLTIETALALAASLGLPAPSPAQTSDIAPVIAVPARFAGAPYVVGPTTAATTATAGAGEAEEHIAVDPGHPNILVAAISDFTVGPNVTKYAFSKDNGATWTSSFVPLSPSQPGHTLTADGRSWAFNSDPVVAMDRLGHVFVAHLCANINFGTGGSLTTDGTGIYVGVTTADPTQPRITFKAADFHPAFLNTQPSHPAEDKGHPLIADLSGDPAFPSRGG